MTLISVFNVLAQSNPDSIIWSGDVRLTTGASFLSFGNAHNLVAMRDSLYLVYGKAQEIKMKYSTNLGTTWSAEINVSSSTAIETDPSIAVDSGGIIHVVWNDYRNGNEETYYRRSTDRGNTWGSEINLSNDTAFQRQPDIAADGQYVYVVWWDNRNTNPEIYLRRSTDIGATWEALNRITNCTFPSERPSITVDKNGTLHLVWYDWCVGNLANIFYSYSQNRGVTWGAPLKVTNATTGQLYGQPYLIVDNSLNRYLVCVKGAKPYLDVYYFFSNDGINWSNEVRLNIGIDTAKSNHPRIAYSPTMGLIVPWQDNTVGNKYNYVTSSNFGTSWFSIYTLRQNNNTYAAPDVVTDHNGNFHLIWEDDRNGSREIYYRKGSPSVTGEERGENSPPLDFVLYQNYPNPFNPTTKIQFSIPVGTGRHLSVQMKVYDILGSEVATLVNEEMKPGTYEVKFDGSNYPRGVYFYQLISGGYLQTKKMLIIK